MSANIQWHSTLITRNDRENLNNHRGCLLWFTGLSGSGKSTIANALEAQLNQLGVHTYLLDGDNIRHGLNKDLGFSPVDRTENIRRIGEVAKLFVDAGIIVITAFISPYRSDRQVVRDLTTGDFIEVYIKCPIEECANRDPKGLYQKARAGQIPDFTGISAPYEEPAHPEITLETHQLPITVSAENIITYLRSNNIIT